MAIRRSRWVTLGLVLLVAGGLLTARYCQPDYRVPILVGEGRVVVTNMTGNAWSDVDVWLNDYYRAQVERLQPDQRLEVPLNVFVSGYGQRFQPHRQQVKSVEVKARGASGERITLSWGAGQGR
jgi:hypothetical protein